MTVTENGTPDPFAAPRAMGASADDARITPEALANALPATAHIIESHSGRAILMSYSELREFARALLAQPEPSREVEEELRRLRAIAKEYDNCIRHMDAGGDFYEFQRIAMNATPHAAGDSQ